MNESSSPPSSSNKPTHSSRALAQTNTLFLPPTRLESGQRGADGDIIISPVWAGNGRSARCRIGSAWIFRLTDAASDRAQLIAESGSGRMRKKPQSIGTYQLSKWSETNTKEQSADNQLTVGIKDNNSWQKNGNQALWYVIWMLIKPCKYQYLLSKQRVFVFFF